MNLNFLNTPAKNDNTAKPAYTPKQQRGAATWGVLFLTVGALSLVACSRNESSEPSRPAPMTAPATSSTETDKSAISKPEADVKMAEAKEHARQATEQAGAAAESAVDSAKADLKAASADVKVAAQQAKDAAVAKAEHAKDATAQAVARVDSKVQDAAITASVNAGLLKDSKLSMLKIEVDTVQGQVTLRGTAPDRAASERATEIAKGVSGVQSVDNRLQF